MTSPDSYTIDGGRKEHSDVPSIRQTNLQDIYHNAVAERVNGILKIEFLLNHTFESIQQATTNAKQSVAIYNNERPHLSLGYQTPQHVYHKSQQQLAINQP